MRPIARMIASSLSADVLRLALSHRGVSPDDVRVQSLPSSAPEPAVVCLQPGGLRAFQEMGLDINALITQGVVVNAMRVLHPRGHPTIRLDLSSFSATYPMLAIDTPILRAFLATAAQTHGAERRFASTAPIVDAEERPLNAWKLWPYPEMHLRILRGTLRPPQEPLFWDERSAYVCVGQLSGQRLIVFAMPTRTNPEERTAKRLDEALKRLDGFFEVINGTVTDQPFAAASIGYRPCWDGRILRWGSEALRLNPLVGMSISYWAIQANRLAAEVARTGRLTEHFLRTLEHSNRWMARRSLLSLNFHLRPTWMRNAGYWPCLWTLCHCASLRRRVLRRLWLS